MDHFYVVGTTVDDLYDVSKAIENTCQVIESHVDDFFSKASSAKSRRNFFTGIANGTNDLSRAVINAYNSISQAAEDARIAAAGQRVRKPIWERSK